MPLGLIESGTNRPKGVIGRGYWGFFMGIMWGLTGGRPLIRINDF